MDWMTTIGQLINTTLVFSTALIFAALGGIFSERSGVINIGIEGFMTFGAFAAGVASFYAEDAGMGAASPYIAFWPRWSWVASLP
ncbi:Branched-chain amino acid transport system / permease component [Paenibacillus sp. P1XP2]|nr:Branched-chain amino acid transport system / permease component [Paenibacillus sp. P1XP2]